MMVFMVSYVTDGYGALPFFNSGSIRTRMQCRFVIYMNILQLPIVILSYLFSGWRIRQVFSPVLA